MPKGKIYHIGELDLKTLLTGVANTAASSALQKAGVEKPTITKAEAFRRHGRAAVERWINNHKVTPIKKGRSIYLKVTELEAMATINELEFNHK